MNILLNCELKLNKQHLIMPKHKQLQATNSHHINSLQLNLAPLTPQVQVPV